MVLRSPCGSCWFLICHTLFVASNTIIINRVPVCPRLCVVAEYRANLIQNAGHILADDDDDDDVDDSSKCPKEWSEINTKEELEGETIYQAEQQSIGSNGTKKDAALIPVSCRIP